METFVASLVKERRLAKATIGIILRQLCRLFSRAIKHKLVTENPASRLAELYSQAPVRHEKIEPLTPQEVPLFLKAVRINKYTQKHYALFLAAIHTGLRAGELLALEWPDIDWRNKRISVERGYDRVHMKVVPTKTKKHRQVDLSDELGIALQELRKTRLEEWFKHPDRDRKALADAGLWDEPLRIPKVIFCNEDGRHSDG